MQFSDEIEVMLNYKQDVIVVTAVVVVAVSPSNIFFQII